MEQKLLYLILAGWALMLFFPSILLAFAVASGLGAVASVIVILDQTSDASVMGIFIRIAPIATVAIFAIWPLGALLRRVLRRKPSSY